MPIHDFAGCNALSPASIAKPLAIVDRDLCAQGDGTAENGTVGQHGPDVGHILHGLHQALRQARAVCAIE